MPTVKDARIAVRLTQSQKQLVEAAAAADGIDVTSWILKTILPVARRTKGSAK